MTYTYTADQEFIRYKGIEYFIFFDVKYEYHSDLGDLTHPPEHHFEVLNHTVSNLVIFNEDNNEITNESFKKELVNLWIIDNSETIEESIEE